jgi:Transposase DDE domain group 1
VRGDGVNPWLFGVSKTVSEDAVRGTLRKVDGTTALHWLETQDREVITPILFLLWILDIDTTVKPLYGHQEGAEIGYNPQKPGRPSHNYHSYFVAKLRLCLGVEDLPGKQRSAAVGMPGLWRILEALPRTHWPTFIRGDCAYGAETIMVQCEERSVPYLFKLKHSPYVKQLLQASQRLGAQWTAAGEGWEFMEATLQLKAWSKARRVVVVGEAPAIAPVGKDAHRRKGYRGPQLAEGEGWDAQPTAWSGRISVLVTSLPNDELFNGVGLTKLYRMRADAENIIDETKNQWGWCGYTTKQLSSYRIMANFIALIYNLWHLYIRFYDAEHHREAITSRPALMQGVGRQVSGGNQRRIKMSLLHENGEVIAKAVTAISKEISAIAAITEQWSLTEHWLLFLLRIYRSCFGGKHPAGLPPGAELLLSG